ncbi:MAG: hypothetical protein JMN25_14345 [gamma proteobacterium endosymbiont of Lamellibrachia anaximandri]|nr:hypothetical protein [gamma proteobacterium endosymbiont of Lamellibrachia anaximandri]
MAQYFPAVAESEFAWTAFVERHAAHFGVSRVLQAEEAANLRRTGFIWSERPYTLCLAANRQYIAQALDNDNISGLITHSRFIDKLAGHEQKMVICCDEPAELFYAIHNLVIHRPFMGSVTTESSIASSAQIAPSAIIHEGVTIGERVTIHDGAIILPGTVIREDSEIHPGVTLGTTGFFSKPIFGKKTQVDHFGGVSIGSNCIIHARSNISRSVNHDEWTLIADNVHMGIGVNIAHDCQVDVDADISARVVLAGRVKVGRRCWIGAGVLVSNALTIGDDAEIKIGSVVVSDVEPATVVSGNFAVNHKQQLKAYLSRR